MPIFIEAEDLTIVQGLVVKSNGTASDDTVLQAENDSLAVASYSFDSTAGLYDLDLSYFDENDGVSTLYVYVNNTLITSWQLDQELGSSNANSSTLTQKTINDIELTAGDTIRIEGLRNNNEALRLDSLELTRTGDIPQPDPDPTPDPQPDPGEVIASVEAEDMDLTNFTVKSNSSAASGNSWVQASSASDPATASTTFNGQDGVHSITVQYFDESDGVSEMTLRVDGVDVETWQWNDDLGSNLANNSTRTQITIENVNLVAGSVIELVGTSDGGEPLRLDKIDITRTGDIPQPDPDPTPDPSPGEVVASIEAEDMDLTNFTVKSNSSASGDAWVQSVSNDPSFASTTFNGAKGEHSIVIQYFDENDGVSEMTLRVDGVDVETWQWDQDLGSNLANNNTHTQKTINDVNLLSGSVIELVGTSDGGEPLRLDKIDIIRTGDTPQPDPDPTPDPQPDPIKVEIEDFTDLTNLKIVSNSAASGGKTVQTESASDVSSASTQFNEADGKYDVTISYFDENDGVSEMTLRVDGVDVETWQWDQNLGSNLANGTTLTSKTINGISIFNGSTVELVGQADGKEPLRIDAAEFIRTGDVSGSQPNPDPTPDPDPDPIPDPTPDTSDLRAFVGAEGFGAESIGGRGGDVVHVTNLNNSGEGSLRWALENVSGPRIVVFDVEGHIKLNSAIIIEDPYVTLAGQTAPGEGIIVSGARIQIATNDVIIRGMKMRVGDDPDGDAVHTRDAISIGGKTADGVENIIVDHNSLTWASDETLSVWGTAKNVTLSNNIIAESLNDSIHVDDSNKAPDFEMPHGKGMIIGHKQGDNRYDNSENLTITKNLFASNEDRNANIKQGENIEFVNNYVSNFGGKHHSALSLGGASTDGEDKIIISVKGNYYEGGQDTDLKASDNLVQLLGSSGGSKIFIDGNNDDNLREDNIYKNKSDGHKLSDDGRAVNDDPFVTSDVVVLDYQDVKSYVLNNAGARVNGETDVIDTRILSEVENGTTKIIDVINIDHYNDREFKIDVGATKATKDSNGVMQEQILSNEKRVLLDDEDAYGAYNFSGQQVADADNDGMADWFENQYSQYGFDVNQADDALDYDGDGYTNIEEYINGLITGFDFGPQGGIYGTNGSDVFSIKDTSADTVKLYGFSKNEDFLDISDILDANPSSTQDAINNFIETTYNSSTQDVSVYVDANGPSGGDNFELIAIIADAGEADVITLDNLII